MLHDILDHDHLQWHPPIDQALNQFLTIKLIWTLLPNLTFYPFARCFHRNICNGCGMPTEDAYSSGHLVLSHFGTCKCSNVETNTSWTCLVSGLLSFEHPSLLLLLLFIKFRCFHRTCIKINWNCNFVGLLHHPFWLLLVLALSDHISTFKTTLICLANCKDHWRAFITRNAHMFHIVN